MASRRWRAAVLTFDSKNRLVYSPDAVVSVDARGRFDEVSLKPKNTRGAKDLRGKLLIPGLIDAHAHLSQYPATAADGLELLPWLKSHIFPLERGFKGAPARKLARFFFKELAAHGTTTAVLYTSIWKESTESVFQEAERSGLRAVVGKVMMDQGSYDLAAYSGAKRAEKSLRESRELCERWHGAAFGRLLYAFTPRFALSCSMALMEETARLAEDSGAFVQTHLSENREEVRQARKLYPKTKNYADVYAQAGLLGPRTILAHSIWLNDDERRTIAKTGAAVAHCPTSNAFLASGVMGLGALQKAGIPVALGSDVAAGPSLCLFEVMRQAVYAQRLGRAHGLDGASKEMTAADAFYLATLGGARALRLSGRIGSIEKGKDADFVVVDPKKYDAGFNGGEDAVSAVSRLVFRASRQTVRAAAVRGQTVHGVL